ncbi:helix-turn-helix domain-containing protein [Streptomyces melanogenes]|uniref:Helix-turn-helix domain-containing protein n=1 Tax=Streptomyces melanogenes TaxID=67326 RepID=A0ABZ1XV46_9ACTN|nr:helix-turn-helix domain-containing protein [Streptomyces melanogenes]
MPLDAFAHHGLSSSGLAILAALAEHDGQTLAELQGSASISRATAYRQRTTLTHLGLIQREGELLHLTPSALNGTGQPGPHCHHPATNWIDIAKRLGTHGTGHRRRQHHNAERARWHRVQLRLAARNRRTQPPPPPTPPLPSRKQPTPHARLPHPPNTSHTTPAIEDLPLQQHQRTHNPRTGSRSDGDSHAHRDDRADIDDCSGTLPRGRSDTGRADPGRRRLPHRP